MTQLEADQSWHLQKGVPIAMIITIMAGYAGGVWFLADLNGSVEEVVKSNLTQDVRIERVETDTRTLQIGAATIVEQLSGLRTNLGELRQEQRETNELLRQLLERRP
jgi:hypothetical protein